MPIVLEHFHRWSLGTRPNERDLLSPVANDAVVGCRLDTVIEHLNLATGTPQRFAPPLTHAFDGALWHAASNESANYLSGRWSIENCVLNFGFQLAKQFRYESLARHQLQAPQIWPAIVFVHGAQSHN